MTRQAVRVMKRAIHAGARAGANDSSVTMGRDSALSLLRRLQEAVIANGNVFEVLMDAVRVCSLGQITDALFEVGGQYRRNM